ncbi:armadillo-type protein [Gorgonomyces haynaldii]|nr:armadillo-type protein [Gorgonomyces haynaldii]
MQDQVYAVLAMTVQPDSQLRKQAEEQLKQLEHAVGFLSSLLHIAATATEPAVSQAASIYFKNRISSSWSNPEKMVQEERLWVKQNILSAIGQSHGNTRVMFLAALSSVLNHEAHKESWPEFIHLLTGLLNDRNLHVCHGGLLSLLEYVKCYQWYQGNKRQSLDSVIESMFPSLLQVANQLSGTQKIEEMAIVKTILKIYCVSIRMEISKNQMDQAQLVPWITLFITIVERDVPVTNESKEDMATNAWWKAKKWSLACLNSFLQRYCRSRKSEQKYAAFAKGFINHFAPKILEVYLRQVNNIVAGKPTTDRFKQMILSYIETSVKPKQTWAVLAPHVESLVSQFVFPLLCFSEQDAELWESDEVEFIHKKIDPPIDDYRNPVLGAQDLLVTLTSDRFKQTFVPIVTLINNMLSQYTQQPNPVPMHKYGLLKMMCVISDAALHEKSPIKQMIEPFLMTHVLPEFQSPHGFMRAAACESMVKFANAPFSDMNNMQLCFQHVLNALKDQALPVRVIASLALYPFLEHRNISQGIKPHVTGIMQILLNLTNEIDMDTLTHVMEKLVFEFTEELKPFAVQLCNQLVETFLRIMSEANFNSEDFDFAEAEDKTMAAMGVLKTMSSLILSVEGSPQIVLELQIVVYPAVSFVLQNAILDLFEETFEIIETSLFCAKSVSPCMWRLFPLIYKTFSEDATEYLDEMLPSLENYISMGRKGFEETPQMIETFMSMIHTLMDPAKTDVRESDRIRACLLMQALCHYLQGLIDSHIPTFIQMAQHYLTKVPCRTVQLRVHLLEIVINCIFYNPTLSLSILDSLQFTSAFFMLWFKDLDKMDRVFDKKLSLVSLVSLLNMQPEQLPLAIRDQWPLLFDGVVQILTTYNQALEKRERLERIENGDEEPEDDGLDNDFEDDEELPETEEGYMEQLAHEAAEARPDNDDDDDDDWSVEEFLEEDVYFTTPMDEVNVNQLMISLMNILQQRGLGQQVEARLTAERKQVFAQFLKAP